MSKMCCFTIALSLFLAKGLHAEPDGFYLIEGEASAPFMDEDGCNVVKVGKHATIGWNSFSVEKGETFRFEQEDSESSVINFVTGESESILSGNIQSKGKIYLNHPSKIVVDPGAVLNAPQVVLVSEQGNVQVNGTLVANEPSGKGGKIHVLGKEVDIQMTAVIDASGALGEGEVLIGGSFQGKDRSIPHSLQTLVQAGAQISVDSLECGNGGRAIIWSDGTTQYAGHINARGGPEGGDGGFVEVSGKEQLGFDGTVTTEAPKGKTGALLLDPFNILLLDAGSNRDLIPCPPSGIIPVDVSPEVPSGIGVSLQSVFSVLQSTDVTIQAANQVSLGPFFNTYSFPVVIGRTLTVSARNSILLSGSGRINVGVGIFKLQVNDPFGGVVLPLGGPLEPCVIQLNPGYPVPPTITCSLGQIFVGGAQVNGVNNLYNLARGAVFDLDVLKKIFTTSTIATNRVTFNYVQPAKGGPGGGPGGAVNMPRTPP